MALCIPFAVFISVCITATGVVIYFQVKDCPAIPPELIIPVPTNTSQNPPFLSSIVNAQLENCGKAFTNVTSQSEGTLESMLYPFPLTPNTVCNWTFGLNTANLLYLSIETAEFAEEDRLVIFDGIDKWDYTGTNVTVDLFILNAENSYVELHIGPTAAISPRRFMASYTSKQEGSSIFTQEHSGLIKSPVYTPRKDEVIYYSWIITVKPDTSIYLSFRTFNISSGTVTVRDGKQTLTMSGSEIPNDVATTSANVNVTLNMSISDPGLGFEFYHSQLHPNCSQSIKLENVTDWHIDFQEPESDYPARCFVIVEGPKNTVLSVGIHSTESKTVPTSNTILTMNDGGSRFSPNILVYSPSSQLEVPPDVITSGNRLWMGYTTLARQQPLNMSAHITVQNSGNHLRDTGSFNLPQQSENVTLPTNTSMYILSVASNQQVVTNVAANASLSLDDYILFYDGATKEKLIANFTAKSPFYPVASTENQMLIVANNFKGNDTFTASFVAAPKGTNILSSSKFGSYHLNNVGKMSNYTWIIAPMELDTSAEIIALTLVSLTLDGGKILTIYNGTEDNSNVLYTLKDSISNVVIHINDAQGARIILQNNGNATASVVVDASYQVQPKCEYTVNFTSSNTTTTLSSPNYPSNYPVNAQCSWKILASSPKVYLSFEGINLPSIQPLLIYSIKAETPKLITNISGNGVIDDIITDQAPLLIKWTSSLPLQNLTFSTGFQIKTNPLSCGGALLDKENEFQTPSYPKSETNSTLCVWTIAIPSNDDDVNIINLSYVSGDSKASTADLIIHEGGSLQSPSANMSSINQTSFLSRTNKLSIQYLFDQTSEQTSGPSYKFTYKTFKCAVKCKNKMCLHDSWRCNGVNDCGDFTDETDCAASPILPAATGISVAAFVITMFVMLIIGVGLAIGGPVVWRKIKTQSSYQEFRNTVDA